MGQLNSPGRFAALPVDESEEGCIIYHRRRRVLCAYAGALELLARLALEELERDGREGRA